jgi:hypothetical protein
MAPPSKLCEKGPYILSLDHVLVVPSLEYDLLSISQIIDSFNCIVFFFFCHCVVYFKIFSPGPWLDVVLEGESYII